LLKNAKESAGEYWDDYKLLHKYVKTYCEKNNFIPTELISLPPQHILELFVSVHKVDMDCLKLFIAVSKYNFLKIAYIDPYITKNYRERRALIKFLEVLRIYSSDKDEKTIQVIKKLLPYTPKTDKIWENLQD
jgi:hypothetical protein